MQAWSGRKLEWVFSAHTADTHTSTPGELYRPSELEGTLWGPYEAMPILTTRICSRLQSGLSELPTSAAHLCMGMESPTES